MIKYVCQILFLMNTLGSVRNQISSKDTLVLVHVIFRHGDRNPDKLNLYPNNPHFDESNYAPFGYGQLTNIGKHKAYRVGTSLRKRYSTFLDKTYNIHLIEARSSDFNRTKASLQAMLAGLFPPTKNLVWLKGLNWEPIPFNYLERKYDKELFIYGCPNYNVMVNKYMQSPKGLDMLKEYQETFKYISKNTGENITTILQVFFMYFGFHIQEELKIPLPDWTKEVYPFPMKTIATRNYEIMYSSKRLRKMSNYLLKKIIIDTRDKIDGKLPKKKIFIYCGHENNIAAMLKILDWDRGDIPTYGSYVLIELHKVNNTYGIKFFYQDYTSQNPQLLKLPSCEELCPFEKFVYLTKNIIPEDDSICGMGRTSSTGIMVFLLTVYLLLFFNQ